MLVCEEGGASSLVTSGSYLTLAVWPSGPSEFVPQPQIWGLTVNHIMGHFNFAH